MKILSRIDRVLVVLSAVVIAAALSVSASITNLQYRQSAEFWEYTDDSMSGVGEIRSESTTTVTQISTHIHGTGSEPSEPIELLSEGLWVVSVRFGDYEPPEVGKIPTVNLNSVSGKGSAGWSGRSWTHIYVSADPAGTGDIGLGMAVFTPGEVALHISDLPDDVEWYADLERLGELKLP